MADSARPIKYYVRGEDGTLYGPATVEKLRSWAAEDRIRPETLLVEASGDRSIPAREVPGLFPDGASTSGPSTSQAPPPFASPPHPAPPAKSWSPWLSTSLALVGVCGCGGAILAAILFPVFASARKAAQHTQGLSNMKQLATGIEIYASDFDDKFPRDMSSAMALMPAVSPYVARPEVFKSVNPAGGEILGNGKLSGKSMITVLNPAETIMLHDSKPWENDFGLAAFVDGHAKRISPFSQVDDLLMTDPIDHSIKNTGL